LIRNLYWEVDGDQLYANINERLGDFKRFLDTMSFFLEWEKR